MKKEKITLANIQSDLRRSADSGFSVNEDGRLAYIIPFTMGAVWFGILFHSLWVGLLFFAVAAYHMVRYGMVIREYQRQKKAIRKALERGDVSVAVERLSHIAVETLLEPNTRGRNVKHTRSVTFFHFYSGGTWRVPEVLQHYDWSKEYHFSLVGLENTSVEGNEFFYVSLQGYPEIAYIYPCKFFVLDEALREK